MKRISPSQSRNACRPLDSGCVRRISLSFKKRGGGILIALYCLGVLFAACQQSEPPKSLDEAREKPEPTHVVALDRERLLRLDLGIHQVAREKLRYVVKIPADVVASPKGEAFVGASIAGRIQKIFATENDAVREGMPLAVLESATIAALVAELWESATAFALADADYKRKRAVASENILSEKVLLESESARKLAEARLCAAEAKCVGIGFSKRDLERLKARPDSAVSAIVIRAPISGIVAKRFVSLGEYVEPNKPLFQIVNLDEVMLVGSAFEPEFGKVRAGQAVEIYVGAFHATRFLGTIHSVGAVVNETTHALPVRIMLKNPKHLLKPSMHAELLITIEREEPELLVPTSAIAIDGEEKFVFVQENDTLFEARAVKVAEETKEFAVIAEGLREGERVVTKNVFFLKSKLRARTVEE
ncbi:MAG: efflux RND transporter periplasmic adaptor subunit [Chloroherpetonaceae bacterium]|nr:efflux RND transporter periplasmic adaptor subunit [Chloroherpetonaceae bacterium]